ncbi:hypothetical protein SeMB42_g00768 [Synchytrium endobioticum]|nr:hypothetical protein SeMB42_g00768 [Synchytrium endobioticum]
MLCSRPAIQVMAANLPRPSTRAMATAGSKLADKLPELSPIKDNAGTVYGGKFTVTLIPGDGTGHEIASSVRTIFKAAHVPIEWEQFDLSGYTEAQSGTVLKEAMDSIRRNRVALKGASTENTEGEYSGLEHQPVPGVVESLKVVTRAKTERIARFAFDYALKNNRKKITAIHKANIMKLGDGLFLNVCREVAKQYESSGIKFGDMIVDNASMQLVSKPEQFDVIVCGNLYGNILSNVGAALVGGPGLVPGANIGREIAVFEPGCRHVGKNIMGRNEANPTAMLLSAVSMLRHLGLEDKARQITQALNAVIQDGTVLTPDVGGRHTTTDFTLAIIANL